MPTALVLIVKRLPLVVAPTIKSLCEAVLMPPVDTRARMSQIMGLLNLATNIQEEILFLPRTLKGRDAVSTREMIQIATIVDWGE